MLKMKFSAKWTVIAITTLMIGLDPLAAGATIKSEAAIAQVMPLAELSGQNLVVIARADRSDMKNRKKVKARKARLKPSTRKRRASSEATGTFHSTYTTGFGAIFGCVRQANTSDCEQLERSKAALNNWCTQGKSGACSYGSLLTTQEGAERRTTRWLSIE
jgi:hypothetical protein